ncbi:uncharacterized protein LOC126907318 [Daktulosphaira vitifoliae]|uniref:uncharacterized protein LOC126907318 n=1 Tax=Daktulosphaira vitifoliae TaxID=58002 RepID=UPI0021A9C0BB|nr:uncharacterized protein LOC126907318 [Daktulosphaira vitifoliae]XP_050544464.1 uncharacterized protein LOC126907318 [Daktulosphaira vitifoliae]XP_050544465.1 uncharacterized protein LOC126907318 [Daktulosphaira vitifoliae]
MLQKHWIFFILSSITFQSTKGIHLYNEVNNMLTHPLWRLGIEHMRRDFGVYPRFFLFDEETKEPKMITALTLFPNFTPVLVTENNFREKVRQYHLLLSCYYGMELKSYLYYVNILWKLCTAVRPNYCEIPLKKTINEFVVELIKMNSSLLHFSQWLGNNPILSNSVHTVIDNLLIISQNINIQTFNKTKEKLNDACEMLTQFFDKHMVPKIDKKKLKAATIITSEAIKENLLSVKIYNIFNYFKENVYQSIFTNKQYGFIYDKKTYLCIGVTKYVEYPNTPSPQISEEYV